MNTRKILVGVLLLVLSMSLLVGCSQENSGVREDDSKSSGKKVIGVCIADFSYQFQVHMVDGIKEEAKKYPDFEFNLVDGKSDSSIQLSQVENFVTEKVDAIIYVPGDSESSKPPVDLIVQAGIPLINLNTKVLEVEKVDSFVGSETVQSGELEMQAVAELMGGKGNIVELQGWYGHEPQIERHKGIENILSKYPEIKTIAENTGKWSRDEGMKVMENWLQSDLKDKIDAVVAHNDEMAIGALKALEDAGLLDKIIVAGIDATPEALQYLKDRKLNVTVFQDAKGQGRKAVEVAVKAVNGEKIEKEYMIPYELVKPEEADKYLERYGK